MVVAACLAMSLAACGGTGGGSGDAGGELGATSSACMMKPCLAGYGNNAPTYTKGSLIQPNVPVNNGAKVKTWTITGQLPPGLAIDLAATGTISGTPTAVTPPTTVTVTGSNLAGSSSVSLTITVNDVPPSALVYSSNPSVYTKDVTITPNTPNVSGGAATAWSITPPLPAGLSLDAGSGVISGTPTAVTATNAYAVTASNSGGSTTAAIAITVNDGRPVVAYPVTQATYVLETAITPNVPTNSGGPATSWAVTPAFPAGLAIDPTTGVISGTPTAVSATAVYTVTASNSGGNGTALLSIAVNPPALTIVSQPTNPTPKLGERAAYTVAASGYGRLSYQWYRDGSPITGQVAPSYQTPVTTMADAGALFTVQVSDTFGQVVTSNAVSLTFSDVARFAFVANQGQYYGTVSTYALDPVNGRLRLAAMSAAVTGAKFVSVAAGAAGSALYAADFTGSIAQFSVGSGGVLGPMNPRAVSGGGSVNAVAVHPVTGVAYDTVMQGTVGQYAIAPTSGALSPLTPPKVAAGAFPHDITLLPSGTFAYVANLDGDSWGPGSVGQYAVAVNGALTPITAGTVSGPAAPRSLTSDPAGSYLYVTSGDNNIFQYTVDRTSGALIPMSPARVATGANPFSVVVHPSGSFAYAANKDGASVSQYRVGSAGGLTPLSPATVATGTSPWAVVVDPSGRFAYTVNNVDNTVSQYAVASGGTLSPLSPPTLQAPIVPAGGPDAYLATRPMTVVGGGPAIPVPRYAYVANLFDGTVSQYTFGGDGGMAPQAHQTVQAGTEPSSVAVDPAGRYVYVTNLEGNDVSQFTVGADGTLSPMATPRVAAGANPFTAVVDPSGRYVYVANSGDGTLSQYAIGADGSLTSLGTPATAGPQPYQVAVDPSGRYAYATSYQQPGTVWQYRIQGNGVLSPMSPASITVAAYPLGMAIDPSGQHLYVVNSGSGTVSQLAIASGSGLLSSLATAVATGKSPCAIAVHPSGSFAYVANSGDASVSMYGISAGGVLSSLGTVPAQVAPYAVQVDPSGKYVYAVAYEGQVVSQYGVNADGTLTPLASPTVATGGGPASLGIVGGWR